MKNCVLFLLLMACVHGAYGQSRWHDTRVYATYHQGVIVPEYSNFSYVVDDYVRSTELTFQRETSGKDIWERTYRFPSYGISFQYASLGSKRVFGNEFSVFPFCIFHLYTHKRFQIDQQIGLGLGYSTKKLDLQSNYLSVATGSHVNAHFTLRLGMQYRLFETLHMKGGIAFNHFSNGNIQEPNLGLNYLTMYGGLGWSLAPETPKDMSVPEAWTRSHNWEFVYAIGGKHTRSLQSNFYLTSSLSGEWKWNAFRKVRFGIGADLFYDSSTRIEYGNDATYKKSFDYRTGIHISQQLVYNRTSILLQEGIYLGLVDRVNGYVMYNRGIVRQHVGDHLFFSLSLKSHLHILDYPEFGIGYSL
ncbi:MAG: acyloxyacyl hydrolase [Bacteroidia bacterium]